MHPQARIAPVPALDTLQFERAWRMYRYTLTAPVVTNVGSPSGYPDAVRTALLTDGIDGCTEHVTAGYWNGKREDGVTFEFYAATEDDDFGSRFARIGRASMPDQEAVQVTRDATAATLWEA